jgi:type II secretory pathway component PulC
MRLPEIGEIPLRKVPGATWGVLMWRVLAVLVIVSLLVHWFWVLFAPRSISVLPAGYSPSNSHAEQLFGSAQPVSVSAVASVMPNVRLVGVFAGTPGFAVLELDGKRQLGLATGHDIVAGAKLVEVAKDHVVIERAGVRQQILLVRPELKNIELKQNVALK